MKKANENRAVTVQRISWSPKGTNAVVEIRAADNKDRWLMLWDLSINILTLLDRQHDDDAWIGEPGILVLIPAGLTMKISGINLKQQVTPHLYSINVRTMNKRTFDIREI